MGALRSVGSLNCCVGPVHITTKSHPRSFHGAELWIGVALKAAAGSEVVQLLSECKRGEGASPTCSGPLEFTEEWSSRVFQILGSMQEFPTAASNMHRERLVNGDPFAPFVGHVHGPAFEQLEPDRLNAAVVVCLWNEIFSKPSTLKNLFPFQLIEAIHPGKLKPDRALSDLECAFLRQYWRCLGFTGLCFAPTALRQLELDQLVFRLEQAGPALVPPQQKVVQVLEQLKECGTALKKSIDSKRTLSSLFISFDCRSYAMLGCLARLEEMVKCAGRHPENEKGVHVFFTNLYKALSSESHVFPETGDDTANGACNQLTEKLERVLTTLMSAKPLPPWEHVIRFLIRYDDFSFLIIPIIRVLMKHHTDKKVTSGDHLKNYLKNPQLITILLSVHQSIKDCIDDRHDTAKDLQVKLLYPSIVFQELHPDVPISYMKRIKKLQKDYPLEDGPSGCIGGSFKPLNDTKYATKFINLWERK